MAQISVAGSPIFTDLADPSGLPKLTSIAGYDGPFITTYTGLVEDLNNSFSIFNSSGSAIKTIYFIDEA